MRFQWLVLLSTLILGCDASETDGLGGAGGFSTTGPSTGKGGPTTKGVGQSATSTSKNSGVGPSSGITSVSQGPGPTTGFVSAVTTGNPFGCDTGVVDDPAGDVCQTCVECAINGVCFNVYDACFNDMQCSAFVSCIQGCSDEGCGALCQMQFPQGALGYQSIITCVACDVCPTNCDAQQWGCQ